MVIKFCTKCKKEQDISCFSKDKSRKDGLQRWCKQCYKRYNKDNFAPLSNKAKQYRRDKAPQIAKQRKQHRENNPEKIIKQRKQYNKNNVLFKDYFKKLEAFEQIRQSPENIELLEVKCAYCGKWMLLTNNQANNRVQSFKGTTQGENRFYCSENCKISCPIYNQKSWPKGFKKATSREVVPLLRQLVLERDNYTCQKCGATTETAQLHVHHEKSYTLNKIMANDPDNCITLCKDCHKWVHSHDGCNYSSLKCKEGKQ